MRRAIVEWANGRADIRRVLLVGSRARDAQPDDLADLDVQLYVEAGARYVEDERWLEELGAVAVCVRDEYMDGGVRVPTRLVIFENGVKVDFAFYPADAVSEGIRAGLPFHPLLEEDPATAPAPPRSTSDRRPPAPTEAEFRRTVEEFWFELYHVAKYLARDELWLAKSRDWAAKQFLLVMVGWHERFVRDRVVDPDDVGKRPSMDAGTWQSLCESFAGCDPGEIGQSIARTGALFRRLANETATVLGFSYAAGVDRTISALIESITS